MLEGIAIATILNALTTKTRIRTVLQIVTDLGEIFLHYGGLEPGALRIAMSPIFVELRKFDNEHVAARTAPSRHYGHRGVIYEGEFGRLTTQIAKIEKPAAESAMPSIVRRCPRCKDEVIDSQHCRCGWF